jgi:hypothetical protein
MMEIKFGFQLLLISGLTKTTKNQRWRVMVRVRVKVRVRVRVRVGLGLGLELGIRGGIQHILGTGEDVATKIIKVQV